MKDLAFIFGDGQLAVNWSGTVEGIHNVGQKLVGNLLTDTGTDEIVPSRGTDLLREVTGGGVYDLRSAQHALNFAALEVKRHVRAYEPEGIPDADRVAGCTALFVEVGQDSRLTARLTLTTAAGATLGVLQQIS